MKNYEVTFIVDPVLSGAEIKSTGKTYVDLLKNESCKIVHVAEMGLRQLAYPINKRNSGVYYCVELASESGDVISKLELALRRDERIMRFLTVKLDVYGVKYNDDKRNGLIGKAGRKDKEQEDKKDNKEEAKSKVKDSSRATETTKVPEKRGTVPITDTPSSKAKSEEE